MLLASTRALTGTARSSVAALTILAEPAAAEGTGNVLVALWLTVGARLHHDSALVCRHSSCARARHSSPDADALGKAGASACSPTQLPVAGSTVHQRHLG